MTFVGASRRLLDGAGVFVRCCALLFDGADISLIRVIVQVIPRMASTVVLMTLLVGTANVGSICVNFSFSHDLPS